METISVIIPAYNSEHCIKNTCLKTNEYLKKQFTCFEIIVVNDGSFDNTQNILDELKKYIKNLQIIHLEKNFGKGYAVTAGMKKAKNNITLFMDADLSTDISYISNAIAKLKQGFDIIIASRDYRDAKGASQIIPKNILMRAMGIAGNMLIQRTGLKGIYDTQCGFKLFKADISKKIFNQIKTHRFIFDVELLLIAKKLNFKIGIIPVKWQHNSISSVNFISYLIALKDLILIKYNLRKL